MKLVSGVKNSEAYKKFATKQLSEINKLDSRRVLHCTLETPEEKARDNFEALINMTSKLKPIKEYEKLANEVSEFLKYLEDNWEVLQK